MSREFALECCGRKRGVFWSSVEGGTYPILFCNLCDWDHSHATVIPNEHKIRDQEQIP